MVRHILPILRATSFDTYAEPFCGGAAVFFAVISSMHQRSRWYGLNDINEDLVHFYEIAKTRSDELVEFAHSRDLAADVYANRANDIVNGVCAADCDVERAWAVWISSFFAFSGMIGAGSALGTPGHNRCSVLDNKLRTLRKQCEYLRMAHITKRDWTAFVRGIDKEYSHDSRMEKRERMFYLDPPYIGTSPMYKNEDGVRVSWGDDEMNELLEFCKTTKSKFILSNYASDSLTEWAKLNGFNSQTIERQLFMNTGYAEKQRTEILIWNFPIKVWLN